MLKGVRNYTVFVWIRLNPVDSDVIMNSLLTLYILDFRRCIIIHACHDFIALYEYSGIISVACNDNGLELPSVCMPANARVIPFKNPQFFFLPRIFKYVMPSTSLPYDELPLRKKINYICWAVACSCSQVAGKSIYISNGLVSKPLTERKIT